MTMGLPLLGGFHSPRPGEDQWTLGGAQADFDEMAIPLAQAAAPIVATLELVGDIALNIGVVARSNLVLLTLKV